MIGIYIKWACRSTISTVPKKGGLLDKEKKCLEEYACDFELDKLQEYVSLMTRRFYDPSSLRNWWEQFLATRTTMRRSGQNMNSKLTTKRAK